MFPSPLEVIRSISEQEQKRLYFLKEFPSPLEVIRSISKEVKFNEVMHKVFPSPLEVIRSISKVRRVSIYRWTCFRPLSR